MEDEHECVWFTAEKICPICSREWVATFCQCPEKLECPECGFMASTEEPDSAY